MNQVNPLLAALTAAASGNPSGGSGAAAPVEGGLAALFGKLLAAAQAQVAATTESGEAVSLTGAALVEEVAVPEGEDVVPLVTETDEGESDDAGEAVEVVPVAPIAGAPEQPKQKAAAVLAALVAAKPENPGLPVAQAAVNKASPPTGPPQPVPIDVEDPVIQPGTAASLMGVAVDGDEAVTLPQQPAAPPLVPLPASSNDKAAQPIPAPVVAATAPPDEDGISLASLLADDGAEDSASSNAGNSRASTLGNLLEQLTRNAAGKPTMTEPFAAANDSTAELARVQLDATTRVQPQVGEVRHVAASGTARPDWAPAHHAPPDVPEVVNVRHIGDTTIRSIRYLSGRTDETITVRLVPQSLGEMQIAVRSSADGMDVVLTTATLGARDAVEQQLHGLRDALARDGIEVSRVSVQMGAPGDTGAHGANQHRGDGQPSAPGRFPPVGPWIESVNEPRVRLAAAVHHDGTLDMRA